MKPIRSLVHGREVVVVDVATTVTQAARLMSERQVGAVPVLDNGRLAGIFTERDVLSRVVASGVDPAVTPVGAVMTTDLIVADMSETHDACMRRMELAYVRHLLVVENGVLAGILSLRDLLLVEIDERDHAINLLNAYAHDIPAALTPARSRSGS